MGNIQIPEELFGALVKYFLVNPESGELFNTCRQGISNKFDKITNRDLYAKMHDENLSSAVRESARQEYLNRKGIPADFRWGENNNNPH